MNIKAHIEAGHYPKDDKGRALVPMSGGGTLVVCATDRPGGNCPIFGWRIETGQGLGDNGFAYYADSQLLLPPPPRKVKVTGKIKIRNGDFVVWDFDSVPGRVWKDGTEIPFTGEIEEPL